MKRIKTILLVDDDATSMFIIKTTLHHMNVADQLREAYDGQQAINYLVTHQHILLDNPQESYIPLFILLDLNMPIMNGFEFLYEFTTRHKKLAEQIPICILSSSAASKDIEQAQAYPIAGFITKPLRKETFLSLLEKL